MFSILQILYLKEHKLILSLSLIQINQFLFSAVNRKCSNSVSRRFRSAVLNTCTFKPDRYRISCRICPVIISAVSSGFCSVLPAGSLVIQFIQTASGFGIVHIIKLRKLRIHFLFALGYRNQIIRFKSFNIDCAGRRRKAIGGHFKFGCSCLPVSGLYKERNMSALQRHIFF